MLIVKPSVHDLDNGYPCPVELPISGSHSLNFVKVSKFVPKKNIRI